MAWAQKPEVCQSTSRGNLKHIKSICMQIYRERDHISESMIYIVFPHENYDGIHDVYAIKLLTSIVFRTQWSPKMPIAFVIGHIDAWISYKTRKTTYSYFLGKHTFPYFAFPYRHTFPSSNPLLVQASNPLLVQSSNPLLVQAFNPLLVQASVGVKLFKKKPFPGSP